MNSKELLEQAEVRANQIKNIAHDINCMEEAITGVRDSEVIIGGYSIVLFFDSDTADKIKQEALLILITAKNKKASELEQLLGILPVPAVPKLNLGNVLVIGEGKPLPRILPPESPEVIIPDSVEEKLSGILQAEAQMIEAPQEDKSPGKYQVKKGRPSNLPDNMTVEEVKRLYIKESKTISEVAKHFGVPYAQASSFITRHKLHRNHQLSSESGKQSEETERPSQA